MNNEENLKELSVALQEQCKAEDWAKAAETLRSMAKLFHNGESYTDELRCSMLSFYIDMSGCSQQAFVNEEAVCAMREARELLGIDKAYLSELYYDTIKGLSFPHHSFTPTGCLRVLTYCVFGKSRKANKIMSYLQK